MRFLITNDVELKKNIFYIVLFFNIFSFLFITASIFQYNITYGFSYESLYKYFFTDPEFPEKVSVKQVVENVHINLFLNMFLFIIVSSIFNVFNFTLRLKMFLIIAFFISSVLYSFSDLIVYYFDSFLYIKPLLFLTFITLAFIILILSTFYLLKKNIKPSIKAIKFIIIFFSFFTLVFIVFNFFIFYIKLGLTPESIKDYYLGNPERYAKPKTLEGLFKVFYPHLLSMALYSFTVAHLLLFTELKKVISLTIGLILFVSSFLDNLSGLFIRFFNESFVYLKMVSFIIFELFSLFAIIYIILDIIISFKTEKT
jgi:hypothetical protein